MTSPTRRTVTAGVAALTLTGTAQAPDAGVWIVGVHGPGGRADVRVSRRGRPLAPLLGMPLESGDEVWVVDPAASVEINERGRRRWARPGQPYTAPEIGFVQRLFPWAPAVLTNGLDRYVSLGARGPEHPPRLPMPGLLDGSARITAGQRRIALEWRDGEAPFALTVRGTDFDKTYADIPQAVALSVEPAPLHRGAYDLLIRDRQGREVSGGFEAVDGVLLDAPAPGDDLTARLARAQGIYELAARAGPSLGYEAYLLIADAAAEPEDLTGLERVLMSLIADNQISDRS